MTKRKKLSRYLQKKHETNEAWKFDILKMIPKLNSSHKDLIVAFEKIDKKCQIFDLEDYIRKNKDISFTTFNNFFKKVHGIIRKKALASKHYDNFIEKIIEANEYQHSKKQVEKAFDKLLDTYDPNIKNTKQSDYNWNGFWSLIYTSKGTIKSVHFVDSEDTYDFDQFLSKC